MSDLGQKQTSKSAPGMSVVCPEADILRGGIHVCFVPIPEVRCSASVTHQTSSLVSPFNAEVRDGLMADQTTLGTPGTTETAGALLGGLRGTAPSAIVCAVPEFIWGMSV